MTTKEESNFQENWIIEQEELKSKVICDDIYEWQHKRKDVQRVGGVDLSFIKGNDNTACAALIVCQLPDFEVIHEDISMVPLSVPYIPGVCCDVPTVGVAKNLFQMYDMGLLRDEDHKQKISEMKNPGDHFALETTSGSILGLAVKTSASSSKPVYVSVGHKISLQTAAWLVCHCSKYRIPEPVRQADIRSREFLRSNITT